MSEREIATLTAQNIEIEKIEINETSAELIDEVSEGVGSFLTLITICEGSFWFMVTVALLYTFPILSPVGILSIAHLLHNYKTKLRKLNDDCEG